jgi:hypothetical protein
VPAAIAWIACPRRTSTGGRRSPATNGSGIREAVAASRQRSARTSAASSRSASAPHPHRLGATDRPLPPAGSLNRVSLTHTLLESDAHTPPGDPIHLARLEAIWYSRARVKLLLAADKTDSRRARNIRAGPAPRSGESPNRVIGTHRRWSPTSTLRSTHQSALTQTSRVPEP